MIYLSRNKEIVFVKTNKKSISAKNGNAFLVLEGVKAKALTLL